MSCRKEYIFSIGSTWNISFPRDILTYLFSANGFTDTSPTRFHVTGKIFPPVPHSITHFKLRFLRPDYQIPTWKTTALTWKNACNKESNDLLNWKLIFSWFYNKLRLSRLTIFWPRTFLDSNWANHKRCCRNSALSFFSFSISLVSSWHSALSCWKFLSVLCEIAKRATSHDIPICGDWLPFPNFFSYYRWGFNKKGS